MIDTLKCFVRCGVILQSCVFSDLFQIPNRRIRWNSEYVFFVSFSHGISKRAGPTDFIVSREPFVRQFFTMFIKHFQTLPVSRFMIFIFAFWNMSSLTPCRIIVPGPAVQAYGVTTPMVSSRVTLGTGVSKWKATNGSELL